MAGLGISCPPGTDTEQGANHTGAYKLSWKGPDGATFRLRETKSGAQARVLYEGDQHASTVTGRPGGDYAYEVGIVQSGHVTRWSDACNVLVRPYPLGLAFAFFTVGFAVTLATVLLIVRGHRAHRRGELG